MREYEAPWYSTQDEIVESSVSRHCGYLFPIPNSSFLLCRPLLPDGRSKRRPYSPGTNRSSCPSSISIRAEDSIRARC